MRHRKRESKSAHERAQLRATAGELLLPLVLHCFCFCLIKLLFWQTQKARGPPDTEKLRKAKL